MFQFSSSSSFLRYPLTVLCLCFASVTFSASISLIISALSCFFLLVLDFLPCLVTFPLFIDDWSGCVPLLIASSSSSTEFCGIGFSRFSFSANWDRTLVLASVTLSLAEEDSSTSKSGALSRPRRAARLFFLSWDSLDRLALHFWEN